MKLVIVESPAKAKTIEGYLGKDYKVLASYGHLRDLPKSKMGINETTFDPEYIIPVKSRKNVTAIKKASAEAELVILATDEDREGEAISWHILFAADIPDKKYQRITFNEITKEAILNAVANPREINQNLVDAQQGRRVLDRIVGYNLSPLLWKKIRRGLSAGRVQSVAVRLIVEKEREIQAFKADEYWEIVAKLSASSDQGPGKQGGQGTEPNELLDNARSKEFEAKLTKRNNEAIELKNEKDSSKVLSEIDGKDFIVDKVDEKEMKKSPSAPFTTSTLQQEASRKLRFSAKKTMMLAQKLYEGMNVPGEGSVGLITYMRTDSTNLSDQALTQARSLITEIYGKEYLSQTVRTWKKKKGAQEAHEAVRPTGFNRLPENLKDTLEPDMLKLYELIWRRAMASQMSEEILDLMGVDIKTGDYTFRANGKKVKFEGFTKVYNFGAGDKDVILPTLTVDDKCELKEITPLQKFTKPPARYSEATLVKKLEENGIGRPSTYAPTISTIKDRGYVRVEERYLHPEEIAFIVIDGLVKFFPEVVDIDFTAKMEDDLDRVAEGKIEWKKPIKEFYRPFMTAVTKAEENWKYDKPKDEPTDEVCEKCGSPMVIKIGRFGKFMACSGFPDCKNTKTMAESLGPCPKCKEGNIIARRTKRGRTFFGCSRYPECDFATWKLESEEK